MKTLQILGTGCRKCQLLADNAEAAARALGLDYRLEKVTDPGRIAEFGVAMTPAIAVDGKVLASGRVLSPESLEELMA